MSDESFEWLGRVVAIDSSVLVGALNKLDHRHIQAKALLAALQDVAATLVYFDCVVAESISTILRRLSEKQKFSEVHSFLAEIAEALPANRLTWILPDSPRLYDDILALIGASSGELNFNDALIALACRERGIAVVASFDADFDAVNWLQRIERSEQIDV